MKKINQSSLVVAIAAATAAMASVPASGQNSGYAIEEIMVTSRRVEENLQDTPVAVSAYTGDSLEARQINGTDDLGKITPNLEFTNNAPLAGNNNSSQAFIRGIGQVSARSNVDPGVGLYIDDVYMGQSVGGTMEMRDISGIEVLRGPQGALFGRNTIGGAVLIKTTEPGHEFGGKLRVTTGSDGLLELFGAVDLPFSDNVRSRFSFGSKQQDGYVTRLNDGTDLGDTDNYTFTGKLFFTPSDDLELKFQFDHTKADENGAPLVFAAYNNNTDESNPSSAAHFGAIQSIVNGCPDAYFINPGPPGQPVFTIENRGDAGFPISGLSNIVGGSNVDLSVVGGTNGAGTTTAGGPPRGYTAENSNSACVNNQYIAGEFSNNGTGPVESSLENSGVSFHAKYDINDEFTFKSISAFRELSWTGKRDADNTPFTILHTDYESDGDQFSQEFQLLYQGATVNGVTGVYYFEEEVEDILTVDLANRISLDSDNNTTENDNWAVFTQWTYHATDQLSLTLGARRTEENKGSTPEQFDYTDLSLGDDTPSVLTTTLVGTQGQVGGAAGFGEYYLEPKKYEETYSATTISASASYRWNNSVMTYASYSEGFKGGGWNSSFNVPQTLEALDSFHQFDQEEAESIELGLKADLFEKSLRINAAVFSTDYTNLQFIFRVGPAPYLLNAGEASIKGAEVEITWIPSGNWIVEGGLGYLDDKIDSISTDFAALGASTSITTANTLPYTPELQWNIGVGYSAEFGDIVVEPRVDVSYRDETFFDTSNTALIAQTDTITTVDASMAISSNNSDWRVVIGINNATDEVYPVSGNSSLSTGTGYAEIAYARPREYFASFSYNF